MSVSTNDVIILNTILEDKRIEASGLVKESDYFEVFTFEQVLKKYDLSWDEVLAGKTDGGDDGGIDGFYTFLEGILLNEDTEINTLFHKKRNALIEVCIIQSKRSEAFSEKAVDKVILTCKEIFDLSKKISDLKPYYKADLLEKVEVFRNHFKALAARHPQLQINYFYCTKGQTSTIHPKVLHKADTLKSTINDLFTEAQSQAHFYGARELLETSRIERTYNLQLQFLENYISRRNDNYVVLSSLKDYFKFVVDESGYLRRHIFEANVRDYQGKVEVNTSILETLNKQDDLDFWWLNNGITVLASKASISGKTISLDDVQIVNGLQTTNEIYNYMRDKDLNKLDDERAILIRIVVTNDITARDRIIKATNNQTQIPPASLSATDEIQRNIEDYFKKFELFYDRRKNYYKNQNKPADKIISIPYLAQALMAIILQQPDYSRARPSTLIKSKNDYHRVFDQNLHMDVYVLCARFMKIVESYIRTAPKDEQNLMRNLRFHIAMYGTIKLLGQSDYMPFEVQKELELTGLESILEIIEQNIDQWTNDIKNAFICYQINHNQPDDQIVKSRQFVEFIMEYALNIDELPWGK